MNRSHFFSGKMLSILFLGFASGVPFALTASTLQAWMKSESVDLAKIGLFSLVGIPYAWKFLWAPVMDRFVPPFLGRRRGWAMIFQLGLVVSIAALAFTSPSTAPSWTALFAVCVAFFSASQDIVLDAYRTDLLETDEVGPGAAYYTTGYRIAAIFSGAIALILADHLPWRDVYLIMGASMVIGMTAVLMTREPESLKKLAPQSMKDAVIRPFVEFFRRRAALEILLFVVLYKLGVFITLALNTAFLIEMGFTKTEIGTVSKVFGMASSIVGTIVGGTAMVKWGIRKSLWIFGFTQTAAGLSFAILAHLGNHYPMMVVSNIIENLCAGMATAAYSGFLMVLCDKRYTATQYALLTSLMALTRSLSGAASGYLAEGLGWEGYFIVAAVAAFPGLLLLLRYSKWSVQPEQQPRLG